MPKYYAMKLYRGQRDKAPHILNLITRRRRVVIFRLQPHYTQEEASSTNWIRVCIDLKICLNMAMKRKIPVPLPGSEPWLSSL
jgi:hypothetical protein